MYKLTTIEWKGLALTAPVVSVLHMSLLFFLFMNPLSQQIIFSESLGQSDKLVEVWTEIKPVPTLISLLPALIISPLVYSLIFATLYDSIPGKPGISKGFTFGIMLWALVAVFLSYLPQSVFLVNLYTC